VPVPRSVSTYALPTYQNHVPKSWVEIGRFATHGRPPCHNIAKVLAKLGGALALSMAFHELATKAVKCDAPSSDEGRVDIAWSLDESDGNFALDWVGRLGEPRVQAKRHRRHYSRTARRGPRVGEETG
jgi:hypothetical protein